MGENDPLTQMVIGCAIEVHRTLGPGLMESAYQKCLAHELMLEEISFVFEYPVPIHYKEIHLDCGYRIDIVTTQVVFCQDEGGGDSIKQKKV